MSRVRPGGMSRSISSSAAVRLRFSKNNLEESWSYSFNEEDKF